jgi:RND family efflux transporter MFP subunit
MRLDPSKLDTSFVQAQATLLNDQTTLANLQAGPTVAQRQNAQLTVVQDTQAVTTAQNTLNSVLKPSVAYYQQQLIQAQYALTATQQNSQVTEFQVSLNAAQDALTTAANNLQSIKDLDARYPGYGDQHSRLTNAQTAYNAALTAYQTQLFNYQQAHNNNSVSLLNAQQALTTAQANLNAAQTGPNSAAAALDRQQLATDQANLAQAQTDLANLIAGATLTDVTSAQAKIAVDQAVLAKTALLAPFDGTVTEIDSQSGDAVSAGTQALVLADLSSLQVQVQVSEVDIARIKLGQTVNLTLDAVAGKTFTGTVSAVGYLGTTTQGVVNFPLTVVIAKPAPILKPGMTASAAIVTDQKSNVLLVPNRAIHVVGGQRTVTVLFEGQQIPVTVQVGLSNDTQSEITGGQLKEGDTIVLNTPAAASSTGGGGGGFGGGLGGLGRGG